MIRFVLRFATFAAAAALVGCAGHPPAQASMTPAAIEQHRVAVPVYILPNCQTHAGQHHCQWIEPRGYEGSSKKAPAKTSIQGIAL